MQSRASMRPKEAHLGRRDDHSATRTTGYRNSPGGHFRPPLQRPENPVIFVCRARPDPYLRAVMVIAERQIRQKNAVESRVEPASFSRPCLDLISPSTQIGAEFLWVAGAKERVALK